jgi:aspartyl/asparaginyl beta-hydroxylase (cupin superfamily)
MSRLQMALDIVARRRDPLPLADPLQRPVMLAYPGLESSPVWDSGRFEWASRVEDAYLRIRGELEHLLRQRRGFRTVWKNTTELGEWAAMWFYLYEKPYTENTAMCPETAGILAGIPRRTGWACFSAMTPGTHTRPHCGTTNAKLRCHLPLRVPEGCKMRVGNEVRRWVEGKLLVFDDSFEHEVWTAGDRARIVLVFDVYHPDLRPEEMFLLEAIQRKHDLAATVDRDSNEGVERPDACSWVYESDTSSEPPPARQTNER